MANFARKKMVMKSEFNVPAQVKVPPPILFPFLWQSSQGCIYLRNHDNQDVIVSPRVVDGKLGRVTCPYTDDGQAWERRLPPGSTVTLTQTE